MGIKISAIGQPGYQQNLFQAAVTVLSDQSLDNPVAALIANLADVHTALNTSSAFWDVTLLYFLRSTQPGPSQFAYAFSMGFARKGSNFSNQFRGPAGSQGDAGPTGAPGPSGGPVGATGAMGPTGPGVSFAGDIVQTGASQNVIGLRGTPLTGVSPVRFNVISFDGTNYTPTNLTSDPEIIGPAFTASLVASVPLVELGSTVVTPAFTASYGIYGGSLFTAVLTNSDNGESRNVFGTPTSFNSAQNYSHSTYGQFATFTLTATRNGLTRTSNATVTWVQKVYTGLGSAGQTTAGFIQSLTGVLQTTKNGAYSIPSGAGKFYIAYRLAYGTSNFNVNGFSGGFQAPTSVSVTNSFGITETYYLYESENGNLGPVSVTVSN